MKKQYLGDSVYAAWDGWIITLTIENELGRHEQTIFLEPAVLDELIRFYRQMVTEAAGRKTP